MARYSGRRPSCWPTTPCLCIVYKICAVGTRFCTVIYTVFQNGPLLCLKNNSDKSSQISINFCHRDQLR